MPPSQPETHHVPIERVQTVIKAHPVWRRFFPAEDVEEVERELSGSVEPALPSTKAGKGSFSASLSEEEQPARS